MSALAGLIQSITLLTICAVGALVADPSALMAQQPLQVGVIVPMTGPLAMTGIEIQSGAKFAADAINAHGGVRGRNISLITYDDSCRPDQAMTQAQRLIQQEKATVIIGTPCTASAFAVRGVTESAKVVHIAINSAPGLTGPEHNYVLRLFGREDKLARMVVDIARVQYRGSKVSAWLSASAPTFSTVFQSTAQSTGLVLDRVEPKATTEQPLPNWSSLGEVLVLSPGFSTSQLRQFVSANAQSSMILAGPITREQDLSIVREASNVRLISNPGPELFPQAREIVAQAGPRGAITSGYFIYGYAAVQTAAALMTASADVSGDSLRAIAKVNVLPTILGNLRFDTSGDVSDWPFAVWTKSGPTLAAVDVCKAPDCRDYSACSPDCPK